MNNQPVPKFPLSGQGAWLLYAVWAVAGALLLVILLLAGALLGRSLNRAAQETAQAEQVATRLVLMLTAQPTPTMTATSTSTHTPTATATATSTPDLAATEAARRQEIATAAALTVAALPTATSPPTPTQQPTPDLVATRYYLEQMIVAGVASTLTAQPTSTTALTPDTEATRRALLAGIARAVELTRAAEPTDTATPTPDIEATKSAWLTAVARIVDLTRAAIPTDTATPTPDIEATKSAWLTAVARAVDLTRAAIPTDTATPTPDIEATKSDWATDIARIVDLTRAAEPTDTPTRRPDVKGTELAQRRMIDVAIAATLTALPPLLSTPCPPCPVCTPCPVCPVLTPCPPCPVCTPCPLCPVLTPCPTCPVCPMYTPCPVCPVCAPCETPTRERWILTPFAPLVRPTNTPTAGCADAAKLMADVTVPDGTAMQPGSPFDKVWRVMNVGYCPWGAGYELRFVSGNRLGAPERVALPTTSPGATADITVPMVAPTVPGSYQGIWQLVNGQGQSFGDRLSVSITVPGAPETKALFWAEPPYVNAGGCLFLRWDVQNARAVYLNRQPVASQGQQQVCLCERTVYTLQVVKQNGQTIDQPLLVEVYGSCTTPTWTPPPPVRASVTFRADDSTVKAGACTTLRWDVEGVREVYLDGDPTVGHSTKKICPCETESHVLTVVYQNGASEDFSVTVNVVGSCRRRDTSEGGTPQEPFTPFTPLLPVKPPELFWIPPIEIVPIETATPILW